MIQQVYNNRDYFRIPFADLPGTMQVMEVGGRPITTEPRPVSIIDASGGGLCVIAHDDLPIRRNVVAVFEFTLMSQPFRFFGTFVRKIDDLKKFEYGIRFVDIDERHQGELIGVLGRLQVERHIRTRQATGA